MSPCLYFDMNELCTVTLELNHLPSTLDVLPLSLDKNTNSTNVTRVQFLPRVIFGLSLLLFLFLAPRGFSPGTPVFPSPQKPTFPNSNSIWNCQTLYHEPLARVIAQALPVFDIKLAFTFFFFTKGAGRVWD